MLADGTDTENDLTINFGGLVQATDSGRRHGDGDGDGERRGRRRHAGCGCRDVDGHGGRGRAAASGIDGAARATSTRHRWRPTSRDGLGDGTVPVGGGRSAELRVQHGGYRCRAA